jgi:SsrA-binding protein
MGLVSIFNRKASFDFEFLEKFEAGIVLHGSEVKSIRAGNVSFADSFCYFKDHELFMKNVDMAAKGDKMFTHTPKRDRKLLLRRRELRKLESSLIKGLSIIPIKFYMNSRSLIKVEIALSRGKKNYDKRESIKKKDLERSAAYE